MNMSLNNQKIKIDYNNDNVQINNTFIMSH